MTRIEILTRGKERPDDLVKNDLTEILGVVMLEHGCHVRTMISAIIATYKERKQAYQDLYTLVSKNCRTLYRPNEKPLNG